MDLTNHADIEARDLASRYVAGTLPPGEADAFEQHLLFCGECQERVELEQTLGDGVRAWTAEQALRQAAVHAGVLAWLARHARSRAAAFALTALFVAAVPGGFLLREVARLRGELAQARAAAADQQGVPRQATGGAAADQQGVPRPATGGAAADQQGVPRPATGGAAADQQGVPRQATGGAAADQPGAARRIAALEGTLQAEREQARQAAAAAARQGRDERERLESELAAERQPRIDTPIVTLSALRSGGENEPPAVRVALPPPVAAAGGSVAARPGAWITLALEIEGPRYPTYAATLAKAHGAAVWRGAGLHLDASDALTLSLPASLLSAGDFEVRVEGLAAGSPPAPVARFAFRAVGGR